MKRTTYLLLCLSGAASLCACAGSPEPAPLSASKETASRETAPRESPGASAQPIAAAAPSASASAASTAAPQATQEAAVAPPPDEIVYPSTGLATIPDDCKDSSVVLTTAPKKMGWDYDWMWTRQALYANPQFQIIDWPGKPDKPMQTRLDMYEIPGGFALVGVCRDGATCNKLAAMYRSTVPTCSPKLYCGALPVPGTPRQSRILPADGKWIPAGDAELIGRCARIGVCLGVKHEHLGHNPGVACQSAPASFRVECAKKATCDEVVACLR